MTKKTNNRTTEGLRNILFEEIEELRGPDSNPQKSQAVANIAKQIINTAKVELDFARAAIKANEEGHQIKLGSLQLGTN